MLICLEGTDGSGKSKHSAILASRMAARLHHFPDRLTLIGKAIDGYLKGEWRAIRQFEGSTASYKESLQLNAVVFQALQLANRAETLDLLKSATTEDIVLDRYWQSGVVYGSLDGIDERDLIEMHKGLPKAALNLLLDVTPETALARIDKREKAIETYERDVVIRKARQAYRELWWRLSREEPGRWIIIDANRAVDTVAQIIWQAVQDVRAAEKAPSPS